MMSDGYGISNVVTIVEELRAEEREFRAKMDKFNQYMRSKHLPAELRDQIREFLHSVRRVKNERFSVDDELELLSQLSFGLRSHIACE